MVDKGDIKMLGFNRENNICSRGNRNLLERIMNWKFVLSITCIILYLVYFQALHLEEIKAPSEGWSREILVKELKVEDIWDAKKTNNIVTLPLNSENAFLILYTENNRFSYHLVDTEGNILSQDNLALEVGNVEKLQVIKDGDMIYLYSLEDDMLNRYEFNWDTKDIAHSQTISKSVRDFVAKESLLIYLDESSLKIVDSSNKVSSIEDIDVVQFEATKKGDIYHIGLVDKKSKGSRILKYYTYDTISKEITYHSIDRLPGGSLNDIGGIDIGVIGNKVNILVSNVNSKRGISTALIVYIYEFSISNVSEITSSKLSAHGAYPSPYIIGDVKDKLQFIISDEVVKGRDAKTSNFMLYTIDNGKVEDKKLLTKTNNISMRPQYFTLGSEKYLQWVDISDKNIKVLLSSSNKNIINLSTKLRRDELIDLFMTTLTSLVPIVFLGMVPFVSIVILPFFTMVIVMLFKLTWVENNYKKAISIPIIIHLISKLNYAKNSVLYNEKLYNFSPFFLKKPFALFTILIITTLIALYCTYNYLNHSKQGIHALKAYIFFAITDVLIFCFLTVPYIYSYLNLSYVTNP